MKKNLIYFLVLLLFPAVLAACSEHDLSSTSVIQPPQVVQNDFDRWLDRHYLAPYNIEFQYRYTDIESSMGYYLTPADYNQSIALAKLVIALCLEPYDEVTGSRDFIRAYFPKIIFLTGSPAYKSNGSIILGTAEGGKKITLFNVDALQIASIDASTNYFKTIHHEFGHILNQTKPYTTDFKEITGTLYVGDSCWDTYKTDASALQVGLISRYAGSEDTEDFVVTDLDLRHPPAGSLGQTAHDGRRRRCGHHQPEIRDRPQLPAKQLEHQHRRTARVGTAPCGRSPRHGSGIPRRLTKKN